jgi:hypothetical protein
MKLQLWFAGFFVVCTAFVLGIAGGSLASGQEAKSAQVRASQGGIVPETIKGFVIDSACTFTKHLKKPISKECAIACAKAGSDLVIQTAEGTIYWPISADTPATGQNDKLIDYAGQMVSVTGKVYIKGGSRAIVIEKVEAAQ